MFLHDIHNFHLSVNEEENIENTDRVCKDDVELYVMTFYNIRRLVTDFYNPVYSFYPLFGKWVFATLKYWYCGYFY